ncbi:MAG: zinc dependent phospholipase C family protein [Candidatus Spyradocola sp.]
MAEFYAHERLAKAAAQDLAMAPAVYENFSAFLVGSNGPDPLFFRVIWRFEDGGFGVRKLGTHLHEERCGRFVRELVDQANTPAQRAYALGFLCHYALDQIIHPFVHWQCRKGGDFSMEGGHGYLEEAMDSALYRKDHPEANSLEPPVMDFGVFLLEPRAEEEIDELLRTAIRRVYGGRKIARGEFCKAFDRVRWAKRYLMHPTPRKLRFWHGMETLLHMECLITSHCSPLVLPACDFLNEKHVEWTDDRTPDFSSRESVWDLLARAQERAVAYMVCAQEIWTGDRTGEDLQRLTRNRSFSSDAPGSAAP